MDLKLKDKVLVISGGTGGIGQAICRKFAEEGCKIALSSTSQEKLDAFIPTLGLPADRVKGFVCDVTKSTLVTLTLSFPTLVTKVSGSSFRMSPSNPT